MLRIQIRMKLTAEILFRIKVISWFRIWIRINWQMTSENKSLFELFFKVYFFSRYLKDRIRIPIKVKGRIRTHQSEKQDSGPHQRDADPQQIFPPLFCCWIRDDKKHC